MPPITLGRTCVDSISGYTGIATARTEQLHGGARVEVTAELRHQNEKPYSKWFEENRLRETTQNPRN